MKAVPTARKNRRHFVKHVTVGCGVLLILVLVMGISCSPTAAGPGAA